MPLFLNTVAAARTLLMCYRSTGQEEEEEEEEGGGGGRGVAGRGGGGGGGAGGGWQEEEEEGGEEGSRALNCFLNGSVRACILYDTLLLTASLAVVQFAETKPIESNFAVRVLGHIQQSTITRYESIRIISAQTVSGRRAVL